MAKNRFSTRALNSKDEPILVTMELNVNSMVVDIKTFPIIKWSDKEVDEFIHKYSQGQEVTYPSDTETESRSFTEESLLPDHIKVDGKSGAIRQLQNEWSYLLLNAKLFEQFNIELEEIKQKAAELQSFSHELYEEAKVFWEKVLEYKKEKEISQEKLNFFKSEINTVFDHLKSLKENLIKERDAATERIMSEITKTLTSIQEKIEGNAVHFKTLMDEVRELQNKLRNEDVKRDVKSMLFDQINQTFEKIKIKRDEVLGGAQNSRVEGLQKVLVNMEKSLDFDKKDLDYNVKKLDTVNNKLELQLREAKIAVLRDKIESKQAKVDDIRKTITKLTKKSKPNPIVNETKEEPAVESTADSISSDSNTESETIPTTEPVEIISPTIDNSDRKED